MSMAPFAQVHSLFVSPRERPVTTAEISCTCTSFPQYPPKPYQGIALRAGNRSAGSWFRPRLRPCSIADPRDSKDDSEGRLEMGGRRIKNVLPQARMRGAGSRLRASAPSRPPSSQPSSRRGSEGSPRGSAPLGRRESRDRKGEAAVAMRHATRYPVGPDELRSEPRSGVFYHDPRA